jgi:hypothetical protein
VYGIILKRHESRCRFAGGMMLAVSREEGFTMASRFTLEYWIDDGWYVGRLRQMPAVFSQGETLEALEENIKEHRKMPQMLLSGHCCQSYGTQASRMME